MDWSKLLLTTRVRELDDGGASLRSPSDPRTEFERDYGRCIFSTPVRRLQDKAQVFPLVQHDAVRTRLTHSIEVSSVARGLGADIGRWLCDTKGLVPDLAKAIEVIAATCGMVHDLGNPPFGHAGEQAISDWFIRNFKDDKCFDAVEHLRQDFVRWEGNAQTIRLISKLQLLSDKYGLNLTCGTFSAACKYIAPADKIDPQKHEWRKPGYFFSESDVIRKVRSAVGTGDARNPIAYIVEAADDIVYCTVDLEDGLKKRIFTWDRLEAELRKRAGTCPELEEAIALAEKKVGTSVSSTMRDDALVQAFRTYAIVRLVASVIAEFQRRYDSAARELGGEFWIAFSVPCRTEPT